MSVFALMPTPERSREWAVLVNVLFMVYSLVSFIRVLNYSAAQVRAGRLIDSDPSPLPFGISGLLGSVFATCVLILLFLQSPIYIFLVAFGLSSFLILSSRTAEEQFGLSRLSPRYLLKWSLFVCGAVLFVELPLGQLIDWIMTALRVPHPEQESVEIFRTFNTPGMIAAFLVQAVLISPLVEELFFRGFLLTFLRKYTSTWFALVLSAGVFAFAHANVGSVLQLWLLGLVLGVAYEHTGSILLPFGIHACWNLLTAVGLLLEKGSS